MFQLLKTLSFFLFILGVNQTTFAQTVRWTVELDSAVIFSSPRYTDLNLDGFEDIIIGAGSEGQTISNGIVAIDGKTGKKLWNVKTRDQIYTSALLQDIDNDSVKDIFIGGRNVSLYAISGKTGEIIWEFWPKNKGYWKESGYYNFYATQWLDDQDNDGLKDLLVANGGDATIKPNDKKRPQGNLMIISSKDGKVLNESLIPHQRETYYAPHIHYNYGKKKPAIIFASGGENLDGNLWEVPLKSLQKNNTSKAKILLSDTLKGFIVNSGLADLTGDDKLDIINARINGRISAIDGMSHKIIWEHYFPNHECYVAPTIGNFTGDETPDIFTMIAEGSFPGYTNFVQLVIDGKTGEIVHQKSNGTYQFASGIAVDYNNDGTDEILFLKNTVDMETYATTNQIEILDFKNDTTFTVGGVRNGACFSSTPSIVDIDHDGKKELILVYSNSFSEDKVYGKIECIELNITDPNPSFPCYLGPLENGVFIKN
jgi:hypothetical protein